MLMTTLWVVVAVVIALLLFVAWRVKVARQRRELMEHCVEAETLHDLLEPERKVNLREAEVQAIGETDGPCSFSGLRPECRYSER